MRITGRISTVLLAMALMALTPATPYAGGLRCQLGEVVIENLQIGQTYNLRELANLQMIVTNTGDQPVELLMEVLVPDSGQLRHGAEAVPEGSWIELSQKSFTLGPQQPASADIIISIPDDIQYLGKKYQVMIWSHTVGVGSMFMEVGLKSRIIFTTDTVRASREQMVTSSNASVDFELKPEEIYIDGVSLGQTYNVAENTGRVLTIINHGKRSQTFRLQSRTIKNSLATLTKNYEDAPEASYLQFSDDEFVLSPGETKTVTMFLEFPNKPEYAGKKYVFVIHAYAEGEKVSAGVYSRLYTSVE